MPAKGNRVGQSCIAIGPMQQEAICELRQEPIRKENLSNTEESLEQENAKTETVSQKQMGPRNVGCPNNEVYRE